MLLDGGGTLSSMYQTYQDLAGGLGNVGAYRLVNEPQWLPWHYLEINHIRVWVMKIPVEIGVECESES